MNLTNAHDVLRAMIVIFYWQLYGNHVMMPKCAYIYGKHFVCFNDIVIYIILWFGKWSVWLNHVYFYIVK